EAVSAIDAGEVETLQRLIAEYPLLVSVRLESPGPWLRERVGPALDGFFGRPFLLWFVAEDPVRNGRLPANIAEIVKVITRAARQQGVPSLQEQLDTTLRLVCWSGVAARFGVQLEMIDALIDAGAAPVTNANNALVNGRIGASKLAVMGAALGTLLGFPFGLPGVIFGPLVGAVLGEIIAYRDLTRAGRAGIAAWIGFLSGTAVKLALAFSMIAVF